MTHRLYGLIAPLFEPLHDALRTWPFWLRGAIYACCFWLVEYCAGQALRRAVGACPWSYAHCRYNLHGLIRWDFFPLWFAFGMLLEYLHDRLVILTPHIIGAFSQ